MDTLFYFPIYSLNKNSRFTSTKFLYWTYYETFPFQIKCGKYRSISDYQLSRELYNFVHFHDHPGLI